MNALADHDRGKSPHRLFDKKAHILGIGTLVLQPILRYVGSQLPDEKEAADRAKAALGFWSFFLIGLAGVSALIFADNPLLVASYLAITLLPLSIAAYHLSRYLHLRGVGEREERERVVDRFGKDDGAEDKRDDETR